MNNETLKRRAEIIEAIYRHGMMPTWELAEHLDVTPEELTGDVAALVEQGALTRPDASGTCYVTDTALAAMDLCVRAAAECVVSPGAMPITNLTAENARLKDLVRHVQSQPDGLRSCRCEITPKQLIITMPAGDEQAMATRIGEWMAGEGMRHPSVQKYLNDVEPALHAAGYLAWELRGAVQRMVDMIDRADDFDAERVGRSMLADLDRMPEFIVLIKEAHAAHRERIIASQLPPDWPHITLSDCATWAEAIVVALETEEAQGRSMGPYDDALRLHRALTRGASQTGTCSLDTLRGFAREATRSKDMWEARAWSAIVAVRMLAAEAARREQT